MELLFEQQRVAAQINVFLARDQSFDNLGNLRMQQRFAARNGNHGRAALIHRRQALIDRPSVGDRR